MKPVSMIFIAGTLSLWSYAIGAQTTAPDGSPDTSVTTTADGTTATPVTSLGGAGSPAETRIVREFSAWAGSEDNARSLVTGLRQGSEITLTGPAPGSSTGTAVPGGSTGTAVPGGSTTFTSPTRPMGYGNVRIALALARNQLGQAGITDPTAEQIQAALVGGTVTNGSGEAAATTDLQGVLQMRADGMGWGRIANNMGVKLGQVMSGRTAPHPAPVASGTAPGGTSATTASAAAGSGITTAAGASSTTVNAQTRGNSAWAHRAHGPGAGIVTASGGRASAARFGARGHGGGRSAGVVTAAGMTAGGASASSGRAQGKGRAGR